MQHHLTFAGFCFALGAVAVGCAGGGRMYRLGEAHPALLPYQGTDLDPLEKRPVKIPDSGLAKYDTVLADIKKIAIAVDFAVGVVEAAKQKPETEMLLQRLAPLLPNLLVLLKDLQERLVPLPKKVAGLVQSARSDFVGLDAAKLPGVLNDLKSTAEELQNLATTLPKVISNITALQRAPGEKGTPEVAVVTDRKGATPAAAKGGSPPEPGGHPEPQEPARSQPETRPPDTSGVERRMPGARSAPKSSPDLSSYGGRSWSRCSEGASADGGKCAGNAERMTFEKATARCAQLTVGGLRWQLPTRAELQSIWAAGVRGGFGEMEGDTYWTRDPYEKATTIAGWVVDFGTGRSFVYGKANGGYVRCVEATGP